MPLKLMYITKDPEVARIAEAAGTDRIFVDMEYIGKQERQGGMDTVQLHHTVEDVARIRAALTKAELLVRCNPIHPGSAAEIGAVVENGADLIMLPYFKTVSEVEEFLTCVGGRCRTMLLLETPEAAAVLEDILRLPGIDEIHIGLNDLSLGLGKKFMFELLADGTVENLCSRIAKARIPYGFGGIAALGGGMLPAEYIIKEHYRLGSGGVILSRSFCNTVQIPDLQKVCQIFQSGIHDIRELEKTCVRMDQTAFSENAEEVRRRVRLITGKETT